MLGKPPDVVPDGLNASEYFSLAKWYQEEKLLDPARTALNRCIELSGNDPVGRAAKVFLGSRIPRYPVPQEAVTRLLEVARIPNTEDRPLNPSLEVIPVCEQLIAEHPNFEWPYNVLASRRLVEGNVDEAIRLLTISLSINPHYEASLVQMGLALAIDMDYEASLAHLGRAIEMDPDDEVVPRVFRTVEMIREWDANPSVLATAGGGVGSADGAALRALERGVPGRPRAPEPNGSNGKLNISEPRGDKFGEKLGSASTNTSVRANLNQSSCGDLLATGEALNERGQYVDALELLKQAQSAPEYELLSPDEKFRVNIELAKSFRFTGRVGECRHSLNEALQLIDPDVDTFKYSCVLSESGLLSYVLHDLSTAREQLAKSLTIRRSLFPHPDENVAEILSHLGDVESRDGDDQKAVDYYEQALELRIDFGSEHRGYLESLVNKGGTLLKAGKLDEAEAILRKTITLQEAHLGPDHPLLAMSLNNLSVVLLSKGVLSPLEELLKRALRIMEKDYGTDSPYTAVAVSNFGHYEQKQGNFKEAAGYFARALTMKEKSLGLDNPGLIIPLKSLWFVYTKLEQADEANRLQARLEKVMRSHIAMSGEANLTAMSVFSDYLFQQKRFDECAEWIEKTLTVAKAHFGDRSLKVAEVLQFKGTTLMGRDLDYAKECYIEALRIRKKELGKTHARVAMLLRLLAACFTRQSNANTSDLLIRQARAIEFRHGMEDAALLAGSRLVNQLRDTKGVHDTQVLQATKSQVFTLLMNGRVAEGKEAFWKYINVLREKGEDLTLVDEILAGGFALARAGATGDALEAYQKALKLQEDRLGTLHAELRTTLESIFYSFIKLKDYSSAEATIRRSLNITDRIADDKNDWLRKSLPLFKHVLDLQGKTEESKAVSQRMAEVPPETEAEQTARAQTLAKTLHSLQMQPGIAALFGITAIPSQTGAQISDEARGPGIARNERQNEQQNEQQGESSAKRNEQHNES